MKPYTIRITLGLFWLGCSGVVLGLATYRTYTVNPFLLLVCILREGPGDRTSGPSIARRLPAPPWLTVESPVSSIRTGTTGLYRRGRPYYPLRDDLVGRTIRLPRGYRRAFG